MCTVCSGGSGNCAFENGFTKTRSLTWRLAARLQAFLLLLRPLEMTCEVNRVETPACRRDRPTSDSCIQISVAIYASSHVICVCIHCIAYLQLKYKRRVYKLMQINPRKLKQLHTKVGRLCALGSQLLVRRLYMYALPPHRHCPARTTPKQTVRTVLRDCVLAVLFLIICLKRFCLVRWSASCGWLERHQAFIGKCVALCTCSTVVLFV